MSERRLRFWCQILLILTTSFPYCQAQTTYYVASTGNDANSGLSSNAPFRSVAKVNSLSLVPGDQVLFRRGDVFRGSVVIKQSGTNSKPIVFDSYGYGIVPTLAGSVPVSNWISLGNNVWQAACSECGPAITGLYRNGTTLPLGRYPNPDAEHRGYLTVKEHVESTQLTSLQALTTDWTGAEVVIRPNHWILDRATILKQSGNQLSLANTSAYTLTDGWGYFIQNHPATLDQAGEWYYDPTHKTIRLYEPTANPNQQAITVTTRSKGIEIVNASFISVRNLHITETLNESLSANNVSNLTLANVDFTHSGEDGVLFTGSGSNVLIENCRISDINNNGFQIGAYQHLTIRGSSLRRIGVWPGRGKSGDGQYNGLQSTANYTLIENNILDSIGYNGITFWNNTIIRRNRIANFCLTKSDGGGIYGWNGNSLPMSAIQIQSNIIYNGIGTTSGTSDSTLSGANGVFLDDCVQGTDLSDNTIFNCHGLGIYLHAVSTVSLLRNTCFNNSVSQLYLYTNTGRCLTRQNTISQNIFLSTLPNQFVAGYSSGANDLASFGLFSGNIYARPFDDAFTIRAVYNQTNGDDLALVQWQTQFGQDLTSRTSPLTYRDYVLQHANPTNRISSPFDTNKDGWDTWSSDAAGRAVWDNTNQLDKGSLRIEFSPPNVSGKSYVLVYKNIQAVTEAKSYLLQFDAVASASKRIDVFIRQRDAPYQDLTRRYSLLVEPTRKRYELAFTASADEANALLTFQTREDGQPLWIDNIRLQEATITPVSPDDYVQLVYNPTPTDSLIRLSKNYRDVRNRFYTNSLTLKPFSSVILLKDTLPPMDVRLTMQVTPSTTHTGDAASVTLRLFNESGPQAPANQVQWRCLLPENLIPETTTGLTYNANTLTGTVHNLIIDTTIVFRVKSTISGTYPIAAQVTATTLADPDSTPDSGLDDGEDDRAEQSLTLTGMTPPGSPTPAVVTGIYDAGQAALAPLIFPNPTTDEFTFRAERSAQTMTVVDLLGRVRLHLGAVRQAEVIQFGGQLSAGHYLLRIQYTDGTFQVLPLLKSAR